MTFAAEPYGVFVDDLLASLTGAVVREEFVFDPEADAPRLGFGDDVEPDSVRLHGLSAGAWRRFIPGTDLEVLADGVLEWAAAAPGQPAAGATWPDAGSRYYVSYERRPDGRQAPRLTDRNPGSVVRTLAESFAREYAVLSLQLERVYRAGFLATAEGRDLDQVVALVGVERRDRLVASGEVVFARSTPAPADVFIPAGTRLSTAEAPPITVETSEARTLRAGSLTVAAPVRSLVSGAAGVAVAGSLSVIHRPILGIESAANPQDLGLGGGSEDDEGLRRRARRALEAGGQATIDAIVGALTAIDGIREQDVRVAEDHVASPGLIKVTIAAELTAEQAAQAEAAITRARPAGVRVVHNLKVTPAIEPSLPAGGGMDPDAPPPEGGVTDDVWYPVGITAAITPAGGRLTAAQQDDLRLRVEAALRAEIAALGIGAPVIYNRLIAAAMAVDGVMDFTFQLYPFVVGGPKTGRRNLFTPSVTRPRLDELVVTLRGALVALDLTIEVQRLGLAAGGDATQWLATIRDDINARLATFLAAGATSVTVSTLTGALPATATYEVTAVSYAAEFVDDGLQVLELDPAIVIGDEQQPWIRALSVVESVSVI